MLRLSRETEFIFEMKFCLCLQGDKDTIETYDHHFWLLCTAFIIQHISSWRVRSLGLDTNADKLQFIGKFEITIAFLTYLLSLCIRYTSRVEHDCMLMVQVLRFFFFISSVWTPTQDLPEPTSWCFFFSFLLFLNQCASPVAIRDTKSAGLSWNLLSKKHCLIRFRSMTRPHRFPMTHIISTLT